MVKKLSFALFVIALLVGFVALVALSSERGRVYDPTEYTHSFTFVDSTGSGSRDTTETFNWKPDAGFSVLYYAYYASGADDSVSSVIWWYQSFDQVNWIFADSSATITTTAAIDSLHFVAPYVRGVIIGRVGNDVDETTTLIIDYLAK